MTTFLYSRAIFVILKLFLLFQLQMVRAANCVGDTSGPHPMVEYTWAIRQNVCGDGACTEQWNDQGYNTNCTLIMPLGPAQILQIDVSDTTGVYANW
jgi:hypothetical protein